MFFHVFWFFPMVFVALAVVGLLVFLQWAGARGPWVRGGSAASDPRLAELSERADRMQVRIDSLERLLDAIQPDWRSRR
jgi:phage shock protein B